MQTLVPRKTSTSLSELIEKCAAVLDGYPKQVDITFSLEEAVATNVLVDGAWIWQVCVHVSVSEVHVWLIAVSSTGVTQQAHCRQITSEVTTTL